MLINPLLFQTLGIWEILIIAPEKFIPSMQPYADWKIRNGYPTEIVPLSTAGSNINLIKNLLLQALMRKKL